MTPKVSPVTLFAPTTGTHTAAGAAVSDAVVMAGTESRPNTSVSWDSAGSKFCMAVENWWLAMRVRQVFSCASRRVALANPLSRVQPATLQKEL